MIELSVPSLPAQAHGARFAEHVAAAGTTTDAAIAGCLGGIGLTEDLGASWHFLPISGCESSPVTNSFTLADGSHLLQLGQSPNEDSVPPGSPTAGSIAVLTTDWEVVDWITPGESCWHGTRSIDESNGVIIYGEYPLNSGRFAPGFNLDAPTDAQRAELRDSRLLRSTDGGKSRQVVLQQDWRTIRHFHTVASDPYQPGQWWASSGDRPNECYVWQSTDDGLTWRAVSRADPTSHFIRLSASARRQSIVLPTSPCSATGLFGADDLLGGGRYGSDPDVRFAERAGARLYYSPKDVPWKPEDIGFVGNPVRSIIDVHEAYIVTTEAKGGFGWCPQVFLLSKAAPHILTELMTLDNFAPRATGLSYSRASIMAKDGVFFTHRLRTDVFDGGVGVLRWRVAFD